MTLSKTIENLTWNTANGCLTLYWKDPVTGNAVRDGESLPPVALADAEALKSALNDPDLADWVVASNGNRTIMLPPVRRLSATTVVFKSVLFEQHTKAKDGFTFTKLPNFEFLDLHRERTDLPAVQPMLEFFRDNENLYGSPLEQDDKLLSKGSGQEFVVTKVERNRVTVAGEDLTLQRSTRELLGMFACPRLQAEQDQLNALAEQHKAGRAKHSMHHSDWVKHVQDGGVKQPPVPRASAATADDDLQP